MPPSKFDRLARFFMCAFAVSIPLSKSAIHVTLILALFFFILKKISSREFLRPHPLSAPIILFLCYAVLSLLWSYHPELNFRGAIKFLKDFAVLFLITELFQDRNSLKMFIHCLFAGAIVTCLNGFFQYFHFLDLLYSHELGARLTSTFQNPTLLSTYIVCLLPLPVLLLKQTEPKKNLLYLFLIVLFFTIFIFSFSRNTFFLFSLALIFLGLLNTPFKRSTKVALVILCIIPVLFIKLPRTLSIADMASSSPSIDERVFLWKIAWQMISDHPLLGHGINSYSAIRANYFPPLDKMPPAFTYLHDAHPHNSYLKIWIEMGFIGLTLYLSIFLALLMYIKRIFKQLSQQQCVRLYPYPIGISVFLAASLFDTFLIGALQLRMIFWSLVGLFVVELKMTEYRGALPAFEVVPMKGAVVAPAGAPQT